MPDELLALAERCEKAKGEEQYELLCKAHLLVRGLKRYVRDDFARMLDSGAYESAALSLVPEGWRFSVDNAFGRGSAVCGAIVNNTAFAKNAQLGDATTPALALTAACCRAHHAMKEQEGG